MMRQAISPRLAIRILLNMRPSFWRGRGFHPLGLSWGISTMKKQLGSCGEILDQAEAFADKLHVLGPAAIAFEEGAVALLPARKGRILALGQCEILIDIAEAADGHLAGFDDKGRTAVPVERDVAASGDRKRLALGMKVPQAPQVAVLAPVRTRARSWSQSARLSPKVKVSAPG